MEDADMARIEEIVGMATLSLLVRFCRCSHKYRSDALCIHCFFTEAPGQRRKMGIHKTPPLDERPNPNGGILNEVERVSFLRWYESGYTQQECCQKLSR